MGRWAHDSPGAPLLSSQLQLPLLSTLPAPNQLRAAPGRPSHSASSLLPEFVLASSGKSKTCEIVHLKVKLPEDNLEADSVPLLHF